MADVPAAAPKKPHISPSQLNTFENCGEAYRRRYLEGERIPPGVAAIRGGSVHKGAEMNFKSKLLTRVDLPRKDIVDRSAAEFDARLKLEGVFLAPEEASRGKEIVIGEEKDSTVRLAGLFADQVAPSYQPTAVEETIRIELPESPRDILGILDLTAVQLNPESMIEPLPETIPLMPEGIVDYKTSKKTKPQREFDTSAQLSIYDLAYRARYGRVPAFIKVEQLVDLKSGPKRVTNTTTRTTPDFKAAVARINVMMTGLEKGAFMPANPGSWNCSPKWCGYFPTCRFVNSERKAASEDAGE